MEAALLQTVQNEFNSTYYCTLSCWLERDRSQFPSEFVTRMDAAFVEGYAIVNSVEITAAFRERLLTFHLKVLEIDRDFPNLV